MMMLTLMGDGSDDDNIDGDDDRNANDDANGDDDDDEGGGGGGGEERGALLIQSEDPTPQDGWEKIQAQGLGHIFGRPREVSLALVPQLLRTWPELSSQSLSARGCVEIGRVSEDGAAPIFLALHLKIGTRWTCSWSACLQ